MSLGLMIGHVPVETQQEIILPPQRPQAVEVIGQRPVVQRPLGRAASFRRTVRRPKAARQRPDCPCPWATVHWKATRANSGNWCRSRRASRPPAGRGLGNGSTCGGSHQSAGSAGPRLFDGPQRVFGQLLGDFARGIRRGGGRSLLPIAQIGPAAKPFHHPGVVVEVLGRVLSRVGLGHAGDQAVVLAGRGAKLQKIFGHSIERAEPVGPPIGRAGPFLQERGRVQRAGHTR